MSKLEVDTIAPQSGTTVTVGESGDTVTIPTGVTLDASNATTTLPSNIVTTDGSQTLTNKSIAATQLTGTITPSDGTVTNAKIVDSTIELAKLSATGTKDATTFLRGDNTFASAGGVNTPAFYAHLSSDQSIPHATATKAQINSELFDTDNCYDNSTNYRFTPTTAGKYALQAGVIFESVDDAKQGIMYFYKNGSNIGFTRITNAKTGNFIGLTNTTIVDANGTSDYFEIFVYHDQGSNINISGSTDARTYFSAYKIIE